MTDPRDVSANGPGTTRPRAGQGGRPDPAIDPADDAAADAWAREVLRSLDDPPGPFLGPEARAIARRRALLPPAVAAAAVLLAGLGLWSLPPDGRPTLAARGDRTGRVTLGYLVEGEDSSGTTGLRRGRAPAIDPGQRVIFRVDASSAGWACLEEQAPGGWARLLPRDGAGGWHVGPGPALATVSGQVQAFRTDHGAGPRLYRVLLDPADPACAAPIAEATLQLDWLQEDRQ